MTVFKCKHEGCCSSKHKGFGYCDKHYKQFKRHGKTLVSGLKDFNEVVDCGAYLELVLTDKKLEETGRCKIDKKDLAKVKTIGRWSLYTDGYVVNSNSGVRIHRLIMNAKDHEEVDHIKTGFKSKRDNRRINLRVCSVTENEYNKSVRKDCTSGFKGVRKNSKTAWVAEIRVKGKRKYLGSYKSPEEASIAYNKEAKKLHKTFLHESLKG